MLIESLYETLALLMDADWLKLDYYFWAQPWTVMLFLHVCCQNDLDLNSPKNGEELLCSLHTRAVLETWANRCDSQCVCYVGHASIHYADSCSLET